MNIFISYRRDDSADVTGRIYDRLVNSFGEDAIFKDVDSIPFGVNFSVYLNHIIEKSEILLVIIGSKWLNIQNDKGQKRLDDPADFVRIEIEAALKRKIIIVPLLVRGASMPDVTQLPEALKELALYNGTQIRPDPDFHKDMDRLIHQLGTQIGIRSGNKARISYSRSYSQTILKYKNLTDLSLTELLSLGKEFISLTAGKAFNFVSSIPSALWRFLLGAVLGLVALYLLLIGVYKNPDDFFNAFPPAILSWGISGVIAYPHKKTIIYIAIGVILSALATMLIFYFSVSKFVFDYIDDDIFLVLASGLTFGMFFGAVVSRIQYLRNKI